MPLLARVRLLTPSFTALLAALVLGACGEGEGGGPKPADDRAAVERASIAYIEETTSDDEEAENASALDITDVKVDGDSAEAKASSSAGERVRGQPGALGRELAGPDPANQPTDLRAVR